ncbi:MAG: helix-turn-helix transcriptional regulator [Atopobiaceae bacterium]|nr:helix-turn-helix transcriptional regulator [Atopobiaceae bacterium]
MATEENIQRIRMRLGARIHELRVAKGLSQYRFSKMIGMDRTYLISVEKGRRNVSIDNLSKISQGLGVRLSALFENVDVEMQDR